MLSVSPKESVCQGPAVQHALPHRRADVRWAWHAAEVRLRLRSQVLHSFTTEWLADACSDYAVARRVLTDYHPLEPEMTLQLAMQWFPQCFAGSTLQRFRAPVPWEGDLPERVQQYINSTWHAVDMPLADFLRRTNRSGRIHQALRKKYKQFVAQELPGEEPMESLETWANSALLAGDVAVAAIYLSRYNDCYYGQWVLMNVPFQSLDDLYRPELELVLPHLYYQTLAFLLRPADWMREDAIRAKLELEAPREHHVRNILAMLFAKQGLIRRYLSGELDKNEDLRGSSKGAEEVAGNTDVDLSGKQQRIADELVEAVQQGMDQKRQRENAWKVEDDWVSKDAADIDEEGPPAGAHAASPLCRCGRGAIGLCRPWSWQDDCGACRHSSRQSGRKSDSSDGSYRPPGSHAAREVTRAGGRHGAWRFPGAQAGPRTLEVLWPYDLIVVEEVGQLSCAIFERIWSSGKPPSAFRPWSSSATSTSCLGSTRPVPWTRLCGTVSS